MEPQHVINGSTNPVVRDVRTVSPSPSPNKVGNNFSRTSVLPPMLQQQPQCNSSFRNSNRDGGRRYYHNRVDNRGNYEAHYYSVEGRHWYACAYANGTWEYAAPVHMPLVTPNQYYYGNTIIPPSHPGFVPPMYYYMSQELGEFNYFIYNTSQARPPIHQTSPLSYQDFELRRKIVKQVDYYFSLKNLRGDTHLKSLMDAHGWVSITFIAAFPRMKRLTNDIEYILLALQSSSIVKVRGYKVRRREKNKTST